jgi:hypothetical protein
MNPKHRDASLHTNLWIGDDLEGGTLEMTVTLFRDPRPMLNLRRGAARYDWTWFSRQAH